MLGQRYDAMWSDAHQMLTEGTYQGDEPPRDGDRRWGLSLVARLDGEVVARLADPLREMHRRQRGAHVVYRPEQLHITVRSLEGYQRVIPTRVVDGYLAQISPLLAGVRAFEVVVCGLGATPAGILACGYPDPVLHDLRRSLHQTALRTGPLGVAGADVGRIRDIAHVSLNVFRPPAVPEPELVRLVQAERGTGYGSATVSALSLVRYHWKAESVSMSELARLPLGVQDDGGQGR